MENQYDFSELLSEWPEDIFATALLEPSTQENTDTNFQAPDIAPSTSIEESNVCYACGSPKDKYSKLYHMYVYKPT
jgi:hypothetical protein